MILMFDSKEEFTNFLDEKLIKEIQNKRARIMVGYEFIKPKELGKIINDAIQGGAV